MKILDGAELTGYIKERQATEVRRLKQAEHVVPKLAIVRTGANSVIDTYVRLKQQYGEDIGVEVEVHQVAQTEALATVEQLNHEASMQGIIVQLPLEDPAQTDEIVNAVLPAKDVDGLGEQATLTPATPQAITYLLTGYGIDLAGKKIVIIGNGRLVGAPLAKLWQSSGYHVTVVDDTTKDLGGALKDAAIIVSATGVPGLITADMVPSGAVVVDAGTASEDGKIVGDVADDVRERTDLTITPVKGGVGPLTVASLFDNLLLTARQSK